MTNEQMTVETTAPVQPAPPPPPAAARTYHQVKKRHFIRGIVFGLLFGLGLGIMAIVYGWYWVGQYTPWILVAVGILLGVLLAFVPRPWGKKPPPEGAPTA
jgi:hypothetical protein